MKKYNDPDKLTLDDLREKLSDRYACIIGKVEIRVKKSRNLMGTSSSSSKYYSDTMESMATEQQYVNHVYKMKQKILCKDRDIKTQVLKNVQ